MRNLVERAADLAEDFPGDLAGDALPPFVTWLLDKVCLVEVRALGRAQGWEIFETVNDRGQRPGPVDLFKSYVLTKAEFERPFSAASDEAICSRCVRAEEQDMEEGRHPGSPDTWPVHRW